jgi:hypothetical protein
LYYFFAHGQTLYRIAGFIDIDKIHQDACPALVADISAGEQGIIALAFGKFLFLVTAFAKKNDL